MKYIIFVAILATSLSVWGHPVSFEGSKGVMGHHSPLMTHVQLNYSFKYWFAMGVHHIELPSTQGNYFADFASANFLLKRWNGSSYQANLYGVIGAGHSKFTEQSVGASLAKLQFDIEDRKYYFLTSYSQVNTEKTTDLKDAVVRVGVAPYVGDFKDIHTWIILEWREAEILDRGLQEDVTPFVRLFYKNVLFEVGQSFNGFTRFNYIVHF